MKRMDTIERQLILPAAPDLVWERSFGSPAALSTWFPEKIEGEFIPGQPFFLIWGEHRCEARLLEIEAPHRLSYQWHPGDTFNLADHPESELTTVVFELMPHERGTLVRLTESGFEAIGKDRRGHSFGMNSNGWDEELAKLPNGYEGA